MILEQIYLNCLSQASYLVIDERTRQAAVVDPRRDVDVYLEKARSAGAEIRHVLLTHFHADFLSGHLELAERTGAIVHLGARADAGYPFEPMRDGGTLEMGDVRFRFLETPGHTPESVCVLVFDLATDPEHPRAVFTGDTLFVGAVGRPDLMASSGLSAEALAGDLYGSLRRLAELPDETLVYPAHGPGSFCGNSLGSETYSTIGKERAHNPALRAPSRADFVRQVTSELPDTPAYFAYDAGLNRALRPTLDAVLRESLRPLSTSEVLKLVQEGARVLDTRSADDFSRAHLAGSINIGLDGRFASWVGILLDPKTPLVIVADPGREHESVMRLGRIGFDRVAGFLEGGVAPVRGRGDLLAARERFDPASLLARLSASDPPLVVDVRTPAEWEAGHLEDALFVPLARLPQEMERVPKDRELACVCKAGYRSSAAASLLAAAGYRRVSDVRGGMDAIDAARAGV